MVVNTLDDNVTFWSPFYTVLENALNGFGIISGCSISKGTGDWDIDVTSGTVLVTGTGEVSVGSGTVTISDASGLSAGESRIDLITADSGGTLAAVAGTGASNPDSPDIPANEVLLGFIVVDNGDSTVADSDIFDIPVLIGDDTARLKDAGSHELDVADLGGQSGSAEQVALTDGNAVTWETISASGTYTGDGATSQGITGLGFQPRALWIERRETVGGTSTYLTFTTDQIVDDNASGGTVTHAPGGGHNFQDDQVVSLDANGFTVDDGGSDLDPNTNTQVYNYLAVR